MAITGNVSTQAGDSFLIRAEAPIVGLIALSDFIDTVTGSFYKEFRYSTDGGLNYSNWVELTSDNLEDVSIQSSDVFLIEYRYTNLLNSTATFTDIQLSGTFEEIECGKTYQQSIFADFFSCTDTEVLQWCVNVTSKLYNQGIVAKYIQRGDEENLNGVDRDYIDFWRTVACIFAYIVVFARKFKDFKQNELILDEFLSQRGIFFCSEQSLVEKNYLVEYYFDQIRQRGTSQIYKTKAETGKTVDGELLRSICYDENDEFIFNLHLPHSIGWSVGNSSPLFRSCENQPGTNKAYEDTRDFEDLNLYPNFGNGTQAIITDGTKDVYSILNVPIGETAGLGDNDLDFSINVDPTLDYEICFWVRQPVAEENLTFSLRSYDSAGLSTTLLRINDDSTTNIFFTRIQLADTTNYYFVRGILYNKDASSATVDNDCFGGGKHLKMKEDTGKIIPQIILDNSLEADAVNELRIWDLKIRPLSTEYSTGFINPKNFISIWLNHKNAILSRNQLESNLSKFLLPYNSTFKVNYLNEDFSIAIAINTPILSIDTLSIDEIELSWTLDTMGVSFELQKSLNGTDFTTIYTGTDLTFTDTGLSDDTLYYYRVRAIIGENYSEYSSIESGRTFYDLSRALRFDGVNDVTLWSGSVVSVSENYSVLVWFDIDNTYPTTYVNVSDGLLALAYVPPGNTTDWLAGISIINSSTPGKFLIRGLAHLVGSGLTTPGVEVDHGWQGRLLVVFSVNRNTSSFRINVRGLGKSGSPDLDLAFGTSSSFVGRSDFSQYQDGRGLGNSIKGDLIESRLVDNVFFSDAQVDEIWRDGNGRGLANDYTNLVKYVYDETSGNTANDTSGNNRDQTLSNFTGVDADKWVESKWN